MKFLKESQNEEKKTNKMAFILCIISSSYA